MRILSWNCRGIGNPKTVRALGKLISNHNPDILFLMETKMLCSNSVFLSRFKNKYHTHQVDCSTSGGGKAGGLLLLWNPCNVDVTIIDEEFNYIDMHINTNNFQWRATGVYGFPKAQDKLLTCNLINELASNNRNNKWLLFGDFNLITNNGEKMGGNPIEYNTINMF
jgi:exonuclease III